MPSGAMGCPQEPIPQGWKVWRGAVPPELVQLAIDVRNRVRDYPFGSIAATVEYGGQVVGAFVSHHTWTFRGGTLVQNICIPGVSLLIRKPPEAVSAEASEDLTTPDPTAAVFAADDTQIDWRLVAVSGLATAAVIVAFFFALRHAGDLRLIKR